MIHESEASGCQLPQSILSSSSGSSSPPESSSSSSQSRCKPDMSSPSRTHLSPNSVQHFLISKASPAKITMTADVYPVKMLTAVTDIEDLFCPRNINAVISFHAHTSEHKINALSCINCYSRIYSQSKLCVFSNSEGIMKYEFI